MDLVVFENNKPWVIDEFREGRFDYVELASDVAETKFFQFLFGQQIVDKLVQPYPSPRDRHHVPLWMYVCSQLSLRLHGQHSFHSYPLIVRAGGLVDALGPEVARRQVDPERCTPPEAQLRPQFFIDPVRKRSGVIETTTPEEGEWAHHARFQMGAVHFATGIFTLPEAIALARPCESELLVGHGVGPDIAGRSR